jgi:glycosyltransferase involved in cell wall biosynthesis
MIHYWCAGQDDNIGDVILRRRMLRTMQSAGPRCAVYVGSASDGFVEALGLRPEDTVHRNFLGFVGSATVHSLRKNWLFGFNPGEIKCNRKQSLMHALLIPMMLVSLVHGRRCIRVGVGVGMDGYHAVWRALIAVTVRLCGVNVWRDASSRALFGTGDIAPDWAFDEGPDDSTAPDVAPDGEYLGVSVRYDGPATSAAWVAAVRSLADGLGVTPVVLVQVRRDSRRAHELAASLGCEVLDWIDESHAEQEKRLRDLYRRSVAVISDRLHVLVMALGEGAIPLGPMEHRDAKIAGHFAAAGFPPVSWDVRGWAPDRIVSTARAVIDDRDSVDDAARTARNRVREIGLRVTSRRARDGDRTRAPGTTPSVHYMVGGFRISLGDSSNTPGPRTHIVNFLRGLEQQGRQSDLYIASSFPMMGRFSTIRQSDYTGAGGSTIWIADAVRVASAIWCGLNVTVRTIVKPAPQIIYERVSVLQSLTSFHARKGSAVRIVEANGVLSRETAQDRKVLKSERLARALERRVLRRADLVVAVSDGLADELVDFADLDRGRILVVPNGVDERLVDLPREGTACRVIGFVGSVVKWQNLDQLILAVSRVESSARDDVRLEIVGDGAELENLKEMVQRANLGDLVTFHGRMAQADAFAVMTHWDIGIAGHQKSSSSSMYHSPLKLYEYAALGLTIVCTDSSDARALATSGADVRIFDDTSEFESTLRELVVAQRRHPADVERSRAAVIRDHAWRARVGTVLDAASNLASGERSSTR